MNSIINTKIFIGISLGNNIKVEELQANQWLVAYDKEEMHFTKVTFSGISKLEKKLRTFDLKGNYILNLLHLKDNLKSLKTYTIMNQTNEKIIYTISILACLLLFTCCENNKAGTFKLRMVGFEDAENGISDIHDIEFSKVYFRGKKMLELVPNKTVIISV